ncbi:MAG: ExbD/TolR family protein [Pseudomonadota bacterium]
MAMSLGGGGRNTGGGRRRRRGLMAEINVTPFVDVMLVLLIVFMVTAPLLATGVTVDLPRTKADPLPSTDSQPLSVTVSVEGELFLGTQKEAIAPEELGPRLVAIAANGYEERIFVRGDKGAAYGSVLGALSLIQTAGFSNVALVTDPNGPALEPPNPEGEG